MYAHGAAYRQAVAVSRPELVEPKLEHCLRTSDKQHVAAIHRQHRALLCWSGLATGLADTALFQPTGNLVLQNTPAEMIQHLGGNINVTNWAGWTCLMQAAWFGCRDHVEALLDAKASALVPSTHDFTLQAGCVAADIARAAIRRHIHKPVATVFHAPGPADREAIVWRLNEAAMVEWISLSCHLDVQVEYRDTFLEAVKKFWLALGGKQLGPPIDSKAYRGRMRFSAAVKLLSPGNVSGEPGAEFTISLSRYLRTWAQRLATETHGFPLGKLLRSQLYSVLPPAPKLWVYYTALESEGGCLSEEALRTHFSKCASKGKLIKVQSFGRLKEPAHPPRTRNFLRPRSLVGGVGGGGGDGWVGRRHGWTERGDATQYKWEIQDDEYQDDTDEEDYDGNSGAKATGDRRAAEDPPSAGHWQRQRWDCCAFIEFEHYTDAVTAYETECHKLHTWARAQEVSTLSTCSLSAAVRATTFPQGHVVSLLCACAYAPTQINTAARGPMRRRPHGRYCSRSRQRERRLERRLVQRRRKHYWRRRLKHCAWPCGRSRRRKPPFRPSPSPSPSPSPR